MSDEYTISDLDKRIDTLKEELAAAIQKIDAIEKSYWGLIDKLEQRVDQSEAVLAQMVPAMVDLSSQVASILNFLSDTTPEEKTKLLNLLTESHKQFLQTLSQAVPQINNET